MPVFKNTPVKATPKTVNQYVIEVNGKTYKPITNTTSKPVTFMGKLYIPVYREKNSVEDKKVVAPNSGENVNTFKVGPKVYIPLSVVPKVFKPVFCYKVPLPAPKGTTPKGTTPPKVIAINGNNFIPVTDKTIKPIVVEGKTFVPVKKAPENVNVSKVIEPKK